MFSWRLVPLYLFAVITTAILVFTGIDWLYLVFVLQNIPKSFLLVANLLGFVLPFLALSSLLVAFWFTRDKIYQIYSEALFYTVLLGLTLSTAIKLFTGRASPPHTHLGVAQPFIDNSSSFNFGFMREQILGGWPSSHATIFFAGAVAFSYLLPPHWYIRITLFAIALFVGVGVSFGYHWLSEFVSGAALGTAIGLVVGTYFKEKIS